MPPKTRCARTIQYRHNIHRSYRILHHPVHGDTIARLIARRFPTILVDEYQDTNYFLANTLKKLFGYVRCLIVGDPDQAIFEFGGAHPGLFADVEGLPGATTFSLRQSYRCPASVAAIATQLSQNVVEPTEEEGLALIVAHNDEPAVLADIIAARRRPGERVAILARRTNTLDGLTGLVSRDFPGGCRLAKELSIAVATLPKDVSKAGQLAGAALAKLLLNDYYPSKTNLQRHNITPRLWRKATWHLLTGAQAAVAGEMWHDWVLRLRPALTQAASIVGLPLSEGAVNRALRTTSAMHAPRNPAQAISRTWPEKARLSTIHGVKGEEFEIVALYCPKPQGQGVSSCISSKWWNDDHPEERRVGSVAVTRTKRLFILCVHQETYDALRSDQHGFFSSFAEHQNRSARAAQQILAQYDERA